MVWREECEKIEEALFLRERATEEIRTEGRRGVFTSPPTYMTITVDIVSVSPHPPPSLSPLFHAVPRSVAASDSAHGGVEETTTQ